jgi:hypothetical protein
MDKVEWIAGTIILAVILAVSSVFYAAYRVGLITSSQLVGYFLEGVLLVVAIAIIIWAITWGFGPRIGAWFRRHKLPFSPPSGIPQIVLQTTPGISADKRLELLQAHRLLYRSRVLSPLAELSLGRTQRTAELFGREPEPWDALFVSYNPFEALRSKDDVEAFAEHLRNDIAGYDGDFSRFSAQARAISAEAGDWLADVSDRTKAALDGFAPLEENGRYPDGYAAGGPYVSLGTGLNGVVRLWRDAYDRLQADSDFETFVPGWPLSKEKLIELHTGNPSDLWIWINGALTRVPPGKTLTDLRTRLAPLITDPTLFRRYASMRRRSTSLETAIARSQSRLTELGGKIERNGYDAILPCCEAQMQPLLPPVKAPQDGSTGGALVIGAPVPTFEILPLPHKRGWDVFPERIQVEKGRETFLNPPGGRYTNEEAREAKMAQLWSTRVPIVDSVPARGPPGKQVGVLKRSQTRPMIYKFGVLQTKALGVKATGCEVEASFWPVEKRGRRELVGAEATLGRLSWFSAERTFEILQDLKLAKTLYANPADGINDLLKTRSVDIKPGVTKFLPLFYMRNGCPTVFLAGSIRGTRAGEFEGRASVRFQIGLKLSADNLPAPVTRRYAVVARWDDFRIVEIP